MNTAQSVMIIIRDCVCRAFPVFIKFKESEV